ncbi:unnamed protein product [Acanthoscelides obtectus]|uniref:Uncharacterized protein n=1 Tax=Acanthoscelides obtectus TaxID=200917 RepID=A0A9P0KJX3_ACAOB|nr:unnamed protein product [Acanthoscelides obtectus]CAK1666690.1 hypothetical protein AOBTE_LOCUS25439 [Acanthoscelides obtectus]
MGKNKKKPSNVFKVAGAKSQKLKAKARAEKTGLKHINMKNKHDVQEIDKALMNLEDKIRQTAPPVKNVEKVAKSKLPTTDIEDAQALKDKSEAAMQGLDNMQL